VLADEDHFNGRCGTWTLATEAWDADEEVQTAHLPGCGVVDRGETTAAKPGEDRLRSTADKHHRDSSVDGTAATGQDVGTRMGSRGVPGGDAGSDLRRLPVSHACEPNGRPLA
jgi:hypothetical protein